MRVLVDIKTFCDSLAHPGDHAVIDLTDHHRERVRTFRRVLNEVGADFLEAFDYTPEFHFVDRESRADAAQLTVAKDGEFWWTGYLKHTDIAWKTRRIPPGLLDLPDGGVHDLRENKGGIEPPEVDGSVPPAVSPSAMREDMAEIARIAGRDDNGPLDWGEDLLAIKAIADRHLPDGEDAA